VSYPWAVLTVGTVAYLACLPFGWLTYRNYERKEAEAQSALGQGAIAPGESYSPSLSPSQTPAEKPTDPDRPPRLN
jgi:CDP-diacylglycerol--serine O-phosphatidyltransferase